MELYLILAGIGAFFMMSKKVTPAAPTTKQGGTPLPAAAKGSLQPGIQGLVNQGLAAVGLGSLQNTNQSQYGGNKTFMGAPATPVTTQIANAAAGVNWTAVGTSVSGIWNNLSGSKAADPTPAAAIDPQPDLMTAMNGEDNVNASSAFDSAPAFDGGVPVDTSYSNPDGYTPDMNA